MSSIYRKRGIFYYQGKDRSGKRIQKSLKTRDRREAEQKQKSLDEKYNPDTRTLSELITTYLTHREQKVERDELSPRTLDTDRYALKLFRKWVEDTYGPVPVDRLSQVNLRGFKQYRLTSVSPTTVGNNLRHIQSFFTYLHKREITDYDPFLNLDIPQSRG